LFDHVLGVSESTREYLFRRGIAINKYATFYDRINLDKFYAGFNRNATDMRAEFHVVEEQPLIGIVGNIQRWKGQMTVVEAVHLLKEKYPDLKCLMIGDVSDKTMDDIKFHEELKAQIKAYQLEDDVILTGHRNDIANILNALDVFIHASIDPEPYGLVVLEAMSMGKAIIASNEGGPVEMLVDGESGFLVQPADAQELARGLDELLSSPQLRERLGRNARKRMEEKFSNIDIGYIENLYIRLLSR